MRTHECNGCGGSNCVLQKLLSSGGKKGLNGKILGQQLSSMLRADLQQAGPSIRGCRLKKVFTISSIQPWVFTTACKHGIFHGTPMLIVASSPKHGAAKMDSQTTTSFMVEIAIFVVFSSRDTATL